MVSIAHYMRAYFNYQALTHGNDFTLPGDVGFLNVSFVCLFVFFLLYVAWGEGGFVCTHILYVLCHIYSSIFPTVCND